MVETQKIPIRGLERIQKPWASASCRLFQIRVCTQERREGAVRVERTQSPKPVDLVSRPSSVSWAPPWRRRGSRRGRARERDTSVSLPHARLCPPYALPFPVLGNSRYFCPHFTSEETEAQSLRLLPQVTPLGTGP